VRLRLRLTTLALGSLVGAGLTACRPSATLESTTPVANLQTYHTVELRSRSTAFAAQGQAQILENWVMDKLQHACGFERVNRAGTKSDVVLDLNVMNVARGGGGGWVTNPNQAVVDVLFVLTDGETGELLGTSKVHGKSSAMMVNNNSPENEATEVVAQTIVDQLAKSGCAGPRVARVVAPPPTPTKTGGTGTTVAGTGGDGGTGTNGNGAHVDDATRADAESLNDKGKDKLQVADVQGALALFEQANQKVPDARYAFNICLSFEALEQWHDADTACRQARGLNPESRLATKIDTQLATISQHH
jgi:hypothetical protein